MENADQLKGRIKEAAGDLTDNESLQREGKTDQTAGKAKEVLGDVQEKAENAVDALKDRVHDISNRDS